MSFGSDIRYLDVNFGVRRTCVASGDDVVAIGNYFVNGYVFIFYFLLMGFDINY